MRAGYLVLTIFALAACTRSDPGDHGVVSLCRPAGTPPGQLAIGEMKVEAARMRVQLDARGEDGWYGILIGLDGPQADHLARITRENIGQPLRLAIDGNVLAEPVVRTPILDGRVLISGNFTRHEAGAIVAALSPACPPSSQEPTGAPGNGDSPAPAPEPAVGTLGASEPQD